MTNKKYIQKKADELSPWFHNIHLPGGIQTAPEHYLGDFPSYKWKAIAKHLPEDMSGMEVLDIGCNAGYYTIECAKRNASVTGIDVDVHYLKQAKWVAELLGFEKQTNFYHMQVYDLLHLNRQFDIVIFMGVLYHLRYPLLAMDIIAQKVKGTMVFQTLSLGTKKEIESPDNFDFDKRNIMQQEGWPSMAFIEKKFSDDPTNWWVPNSAAIKAMFRTCGLKMTKNPDHEIYFFEPDLDLVQVSTHWNKSEFLSATGKEWLDTVDSKTSK